MKRFFILTLYIGLFVAVNSVWAQNDNQKNKVPDKVETVVKKADASKATTASCAGMKESCAMLGELKACCAEKKTDSKAAASCCTNNAVANETKSSGKKAN